MTQSHDPNQTADLPSAPPDSLDAGLDACFGRPADGPGSVLEGLRCRLGPLQPVLLREAEGDSGHVVTPKSDAMPTPAQAGTRYQLQGEIARGGMGAVLRGRDVDLGRDLAVKVLLEKYADRPEVARRFIEEAQIGGQLQHPGVVPVYDIGRFGERPFFTMKLVKGKTLAALLSERSEPTEDRPRLLSIAVQVAQAMAYAHAKGVIHRDLKPANIMVGAFGEVQVMDWGLAKVLHEGGIADEERASRQQQPEEATTIRTARSGTVGGGTDTEAGALLGTPAYMPPEQANGDVALLDRRADVFGLGAILCVILTGKPPYVGRSQEEVRRKAANGDLADAHARLDGCGADAELIELTRACLSPEAMDRPRDARAVAEALTAHFDGVQDRLRQAELAEAAARARAAEESRRRRLTLALAATVLLALTLGGGGWLWVKNEQSNRQAQLARDVNGALNQATALREQARAASTGSAAMFAQAREQAQRALALAESGLADAALLEQVRRLHAELDEEDKDRQLLAALDAARLAQAATVAGEIRFAYEAAVPLYRKAFLAYGLPAGQAEPAEAATRLRGRPEAVRQAAVAALDDWAQLAANLAQPLVEPHLDWLRAVAQAAESEQGWARQFRAVRAERDPDRRRAALQHLAEAADPRQLPAQALTSLAEWLQQAGCPAEAVRLLRRAQRHYPADFWVNEALGTALRLVRPAEPEEAVRFLSAAVALRPQSAGAHLNLGTALQEKGRRDDAVACWQRAVELDSNLPAAHANLGLALKDQGRLDEAIACLRKAVALDPTLAGAYTSLGVALKDQGRLDEAVTCLRKVVALDPKNATVHSNLGSVLQIRGELDESIACHTKAVALAPTLAQARFNLGLALQARGRLDEAIACFGKAVALDPKLARAHSSLGQALQARGQLDLAGASFRAAIALDPKDTQAHTNLGVTLYARGRLDEAIACFGKAVALDPKRALAHHNLGNALAARGQLDEAVASFRQAIALGPKHANAHGALGQVLLHQGRFAEARDAFARAAELLPENHPHRDFASRQVRQCARLVELERRLPGLLRGVDRPASAREGLELAEVCRFKRMPAAAVRFAAAAFAAEPNLANDLNAAHRYNAACQAALAAASDATAASRLALRRQALTWLRADLVAWTRLLDTGAPASRAAGQRLMAHWQQNSNLAGIREPAALANLPAEERAAFAQLWADVAALLKKAQTPAAREN
jgi:serine/threonine-protein kinase